ncbi:hypothetical protein EZV73_22175 [Acidaminobacter sp. JC074]|uniref:DUF5305 family protein n=1 Tax=Acidaminobacter sp. JC074 TaxID=2530199 RepID=UPI001F105FDF|nr:DUF5305 family protein [Acidaminobacter sp. JC074]MCH4890306.1 hypothetical protein [Acidaminobacter sp. JC074]
MKVSKIKIVIAIVLLIVMAASGWMAYKNYNVTVTETIDQPVFNYQILPQVKSTFYLLENSMYEEKTLDDSRLIINKFVNNMNSNFKLDIITDEQTESTFVLDHYILMEGIFGEEDEILFHKTESISQNELNNQIEVKEFYQLNKYKIMLDAIMEEAEVFARTSFKLVYHLKGEIKRDDYIIPIDHQMALIVPIDQSVFKVVTENFEPLDQTITEEKVVESTKTGFLFYVFLLVALAALIGIIISLKLTIKKRNTHYDQELVKIDKAYGERLARLYEPMTNRYANLIRVTGVDDLIKISDEIRQPVFYYQIDTKEEKKTEYFVFDETRIYYFMMMAESTITLDNFIKKAN